MGLFFVITTLTKKDMEIELEMSPQYCMFGFNFFNRDKMFDYNEINIYFFIFKLHIAW